MGKIRILIADPHELFREGLRRILNEQKDLVCIAASSNYEETANLTSELTPDIVLLDSCISDDFISLIGDIKSASENTHVIILTHSECDTEIRDCFRKGIDGYLIKDVSQEQLLNTVRTVHAGEQVLCPVATLSISRLLKGDIKDTKSCPLGTRELDVLTLAGKGMTNKQISVDLNITESTVASHLINIFRKLDVRSRTEAVIHCIQDGWLTVTNEQDDLSSTQSI